MDKPNLHQLFEFSLFCFPAINHNVAYVGELVFEKIASRVKAAALSTITGKEVGRIYRIIEAEAIDRLN